MLFMDDENRDRLFKIRPLIAQIQANLEKICSQLRNEEDLLWNFSALNHLAFVSRSPEDLKKKSEKIK